MDLDFKAAATDFWSSVKQFRIWYLLASQDIRQRYRRSVLGPFWITLSSVVSIVALALVYTNIFNISTKEYLLFLTTGFVMWLFLSSILVDSCNVFIASEGIIRQVNLPLGVHVMRMLWRNLVVLGHNLSAVLLVLIYMKTNPGWIALLFFPALLIATVAGIALSYLLGSLCARFRDIPPVIASLAQVLFYVTPVIWPTRLLKGKEAVLLFNPFAHFLDILRTPLMGELPAPESWAIAAALTAVLVVTSFIFVARFKWRVAYWI